LREAGAAKKPVLRTLGVERKPENYSKIIVLLVGVREIFAYLRLSWVKYGVLGDVGTGDYGQPFA
jgi:hypothetical protein